MSYLKNKRVVFFSPKFFDYPAHIINELHQKGAIVEFFDERPFTSTIGKILLRLNVSILISYFVKKYYESKLNKIKSFNPDFVFFLNPESIRIEMLRHYKESLPRCKFLFYMWDSFNNKKYSVNYIKYADEFFTFDKNDAKTFDVHHLALFYASDYEQLRQVKSDLEYDLCFIGTVHSHRIEILNILAGKVSGKNYIFLYCPSKLLFFLKKILTREFDNISYKQVSFEPIKKDQLLKVISRSKCIIDISHPAQNGLTMRTIEMLGAGKKIATTNANIACYDFFNPNMHYIIRYPVKPIPPDFINIHFESNKSQDSYSLSCWLDSIFRKNSET